MKELGNMSYAATLIYEDNQGAIEQWRQAMDSEYNSLIKNQTWELVPLPEGKTAIGTRWIYKIKRNADGSLDRFKARLVAKGYAQSKGEHYNEVVSPVARYSAIRSLLALANANDLEVHQMDVKTAFLNGSIDSEIYMTQPEGYVDTERPDFVCKLKKSIYGLKQSARCWNSTLDQHLISSGCHKSNADVCIYIKVCTNTDGQISFVIMAIYVDDIIPISNDIHTLNREKSLLYQRFEMVDKGEAHHILGMSIRRERETKSMFISQRKYLESVLQRFGMENCKPISTPLEYGKHFNKLSENQEAFDKEIYQQAIGCLIYLSTVTRPDIAAAVGILSRFMSNPSKDHWTGIKRILRYLKGTLNH